MSARSRAGWVVGILALMLFGCLIGIGAYLFLWEEEPGVVRLTTTPEDAVVVFDEEPITASSSPFEITDVEPGILHLLEVSKEGFRTWSAPLTLQPGQVLELPPVRLERIEGAEALADASGAAGAAEDVEAGDGELEDEAEAEPEEEVEPEEAAEETGGSARARRRAARRRARARARRRAMRGSSGGGSSSSSSSSDELASATPDPEPDPEPEPEPETMRLPPGTGLLHVQSRPWSQVYVDGRYVGNTPQRNIQLREGSHRMMLVNPDFNIRRTLSVNVRAGQATTKNLTLTSER